MLSYRTNLISYQNHVRSRPVTNRVEHPNIRLREKAFSVHPKKFLSAKSVCLFETQNEDATFHIAVIENPFCH